MRPIDGEELYQIESLLKTDIVEKDSVANWLISQVLHDIESSPTIDPESLTVVKELRAELGRYKDLNVTPEQIVLLMKFFKDRTSAEHIALDMKLVADSIKKEKLEKELLRVRESYVYDKSKQDNIGILLTEKTIKALSFAERVHFESKDKLSVPYILHVISVTQIVPQEEIYVCCALLHDVIEDSSLDQKVLMKEFGKDIFDIVSILTRNKNEPYKDYILKCSKNNVARIIKIADIKDHIARYRRSGLTKSLESRYNEAMKILCGD